MGPIRVGFFLSLMIIVSISAVAAASNTSNLSYEEQLAEYYLQDAIDTINKLQLSDRVKLRPEDLPYQMNGVTVARKCVSFMDGTQMLGNDGRKIYSSFISLTKAGTIPNLEQGGTLAMHCPRYKNMKLEEKSLVWVILMTMVVHFESRCDSQASNQGPNGTAIGYYQMHQNKESFYDGPLKLCQKGSSTDPATVHQCMFGMMQKQYEKYANVLFSNDSYWDVLRPNGPSKKQPIIRKALEKIQICNPTTT